MSKPTKLSRPIRDGWADAAKDLAVNEKATPRSIVERLSMDSLDASHDADPWESVRVDPSSIRLTDDEMHAVVGALTEAIARMQQADPGHQSAQSAQKKVSDALASRKRDVPPPSS